MFLTRASWIKADPSRGLTLAIGVALALSAGGCQKKKKIPKAAKPVDLQTCSDTPDQKRIALEGYLRTGFMVSCDDDSCSLNLMPRAGARGGPSADVSLPTVKSGGKNGMVKLSSDFKPSDVKIYDTRGKRIGLGAPLRLSGPRNYLGDGCALNVDRIDGIAQVTTPLLTAKPTPQAAAPTCKRRKDGDYVEVRGFIKNPGFLMCMMGCNVDIFPTAALTGKGLSGNFKPGTGPSSLRPKPFALIGKAGQPLDRSRPVLFRGTLSMESLTPKQRAEGKPTPTACKLEVETLEQAEAAPVPQRRAATAGRPTAGRPVPAGPVTGLKLYTATDQRFSVKLPGTPEEKSGMIPAPDGSKIKVTTLMAESKSAACGGPLGQCGFAIAWFEIPAARLAVGAKTLLNDSLNGMLARVRAKPIEAMLIKVDGRPALRFKGAAQGPPQVGTVIMQGLLVLDKSRLYTFQVITKQVHAKAPEIRPVIDSFKMLPAGK